MGLSSIEKKNKVFSHFCFEKEYKIKKNYKDFDNLLFEKHNAMIPLDYLEESEEMSVNVEQINSNIILISSVDE